MNKEFWIAALVRAVKTAAQATIAVIGVSTAVSAFDVDWKQTAGVAGLAAILSLLTSLAAFNVPGLPKADPIGVLPATEVAAIQDAAVRDHLAEAGSTHPDAAHPPASIDLTDTQAKTKTD